MNYKLNVLVVFEVDILEEYILNFFIFIFL